MGLLIAILLIIAACSWFVSRAVYRSQVKNNYKTPMLAATLVFILCFALLCAGVFLLFINNINMSRR
jgi:hypothetical protein